MNNNSNDLNQDNLYTQGTNETPNNQPLNNENVFINSQTINSTEQPISDVQQPLMQESNVQTINTFNVGDNNSQINSQSSLDAPNLSNTNASEQYADAEQLNVNNQNTYQQPNNLNNDNQNIDSLQANGTISSNDKKQSVERNYIIDNQLADKSKKKSNIGLNIGVIILIIIVALGIVSLLFNLSNNNANEKKLSNSFNSDKTNWKIVVNGKQYNIPTNLTEFTNNGFYYDNEYGELKDKNLDDFTQNFLRNSPEIKMYDKEYLPYPDAGFDSYGSLFELYLVHKLNSSNDYKNYKVAGFNVTNISSQFFSVNGVGCGSTIDELISALNIDTNSENYERVNGAVEYLDVKNNIAITAYTPISGGDKIYSIHLFINDREYLKK